MHWAPDGLMVLVCHLLGALGRQPNIFKNFYLFTQLFLVCFTLNLINPVFYSWSTSLIHWLSRNSENISARDLLNVSTEFHISTWKKRYGNDLFIGIFHVMISNFVALWQFLIILKMYINILYVLADASLAPCGSFLKGRGLQNNLNCMSKT